MENRVLLSLLPVVPPLRKRGKVGKRTEKGKSEGESGGIFGG